MADPLSESDAQRQIADTIQESLYSLLAPTVHEGRLTDGALPASIGRYCNLVEIARGGMGRILRGYDPDAQREVALKILRAGQGVTEEMLQRFLAEGRVTAALEHPNIVPVHEVGLIDERTLFFEMKLVRGRRVTEVIRACHDAQGDGEITQPQLLRMFMKTCDAVAFAHCRGVVHRDLKPDNIMIGEFGEVLLMDWGLARQRERPAFEGGDGELSSDPELTQQGAVMGTPKYMSPEQARGDVQAVGPHSDIFALGGILYDLVTGRPPFEGPNTAAVLQQVEQGKLAPPDRTRDGQRVPKELRAVVLKAMAPDPADRYADVLALQADVEAYLTGGMVTAAHYGPIQKIAKQFSRRQGLSWSAVAMLLLALVLFSTVALREDFRNQLAGTVIQPGQLGVRFHEDTQQGGVLVTKVLPGLAAEKAGLLKGDILLAVGEIKTPTLERAREAISLLQPETRTTLTVRRRQCPPRTPAEAARVAGLDLASPLHRTEAVDQRTGSPAPILLW